MKKTKIKERFENAVEAFFDNDKLTENNSLSFTGERAIINEDFPESENEKRSKAFPNLLRQVFLFFPGVFVLFGLSMMLVYISIVQSYNTVRLDKPVQLFLALTISFFMTWLGLGNIRKPKEIAIPLSVIGIGAVIGALSGVVSIIDLKLIHKILSDSGYPLYFLPLGLIIPLATKMWLEKSETEKPGV